MLVKFFKNKQIETDRENKYREILCHALETTMGVCLASTSALLINPLTEKIGKERKAQYHENSLTAVREVGEVRFFLLKIAKYCEDQKIDFLDATAPIKYTISAHRAGNCEHQAFYLAALLKQQNIPAFIYDIEDIEHTVVITKNFLLDPWIGAIFSLMEVNLCEFYGSSLNMRASSLNQLLSNKEFAYHKKLNKKTLEYYFAQGEEKRISSGCCIFF
ncbi:hypothetical protein [Legionella parisiensis]|uniref:Transglutaminase-like domain-containing protein n=1 Tax=Legionella parisiensis TaxID=45071 RepID=A0A1E5JSH2_9GAMM|nr:hypothetical protein [Legionella parisiensis]KTD43169.1 hypothetical protein Lpar_1146 [Legionella parisiensis]OEH47474.1 hypothetical protein lpari_01537 [Legionella parisiensis]STX77750.1 Uncharacterised protein [Legionella parisiensis]